MFSKTCLGFFFKRSGPTAQLSYLYKHRRCNSGLTFRTTSNCRIYLQIDYLLQIYADIITITISRVFCSFPEEITLLTVAGKVRYQQLNASWWRSQQNASKYWPLLDRTDVAVTQVTLNLQIFGNTIEYMSIYTVFGALPKGIALQSHLIRTKATTVIT